MAAAASIIAAAILAQREIMNHDPIVSEQQLENALRFLADSDAEFAQEKAELERSEIRRKRARARVFLIASGNVEERKATAETSPDVEQADDAYIASVKAFETLKAKRERADIVVGVWRSIEASRRKA